MSILLHDIYESRRIEFVTIRFLPDRYLVDLGAQYVFEDTSVTPSEIKWPFKSMATEYGGLPKSQIYDSSGMRLDDKMTRIVETAYEYVAMAWRVFNDGKKSIGASKEEE